MRRGSGQHNKTRRQSMMGVTPAHSVGFAQSLRMRRHSNRPTRLLAVQIALTSLSAQYVYIAGVQFSWDEAKRQVNLCQHRLDFADASAVFEGTTFTFEDDRFDYREQRFIMLGLLHGWVVIIAHTEYND
jgi:uncharacterized protein